MRLVWLTLMPFAVAACVGTLGDVDDDTSGGDDGGASSTVGGTGGSNTGPGTGGTGPGTGGMSSGGSGGSGGNPEAIALCARWNTDRAMLSEGAWSGDVGSCSPGDNAVGRANALVQVNLYRWIAELPPVTTEASRDQRAQECALMMDANNDLDHTPPTNWLCYTGDGAQAAGNSNIASGPAVMGVDMYMSDFGAGNAGSMGHRRWLLSNSLGPIGIGSTPDGSCHWVIGGSGNAGKTWTAWPSAGVFPIEALTASFESVDSTGWTIQSDDINLNNAQVTVTDAGASRPVTVSNLSGGYGSVTAIKLIPQGWTSQADHIYHVSVSGVSQPFEYDVEMVACE